MRLGDVDAMLQGVLKFEYPQADTVLLKKAGVYCIEVSQWVHLRNIYGFSRVMGSPKNHKPTPDICTLVCEVDRRVVMYSRG